MSPDAIVEKTAPPKHVQLTIDGTPVSVSEGTTIFDAARACGVSIPTLCHQQNENPVGVCRLCVVDVGQRVYAASCVRQAESGMTVKTNTEPLLGVRKTLVELLMSDHPSPCARQQQSGDCASVRVAVQAALAPARAATGEAPRGVVDSYVERGVDHEACIL